MELSSLPIVALTGKAISPRSGLANLEPLLGLLRGRGLKTALLAVAERGFGRWGPQEADTFCRLSEAGISVCLSAAGESGRGREVENALRRLASGHDVVLAAGESSSGLSFELRLDEEAGGWALADFEAFLARQWLLPPVLGCVLIGGKSSRMGRPKHLLPAADGSTWLARTVGVLSPYCPQVAVAGRGELLGLDLPQLPDATGVLGPLAGVLAARRWQPWASLLVCACDMPEVSSGAVKWLLSRRRPGTWAVIPQVDGRPQPLLALYDFRLLPALEAMARQGQWRLTSLLAAPGVEHPEPPPELRPAWRNVNRPEQL